MESVQPPIGEIKFVIDQKLDQSIEDKRHIFKQENEAKRAVSIECNQILDTLIFNAHTLIVHDLDIDELAHLFS